uniref:Uncharacterized protein n=1 Tax=Anguilla anguilla TaxID=7936 RepID=A0A0E9T7Y0_ANGAN
MRMLCPRRRRCRVLQRDSAFTALLQEDTDNVKDSSFYRIATKVHRQC